MYIYDSVSKEKVPFVPIREGRASIYVCGPTVYDDAHLGHARSSLSFDLLARTLRVLEYDVTMGKNFTDIDDKIIAKIDQTGQSLEEITTHYIQRYLDEMETLGVKRADIEPKATENIEAMIELISDLISKDFAYTVPSGDVYFDTSKDTKYGSISHKVTNDDENQSRVAHNTHKRNPKDFALWKACHDKDSICFDAPYSSGRPGWHLECSAMIDKHFANEHGDENYSIDIHAGGADLQFPHHENEAAQSRCSTGHELAKYWMHNGFVQINGEKMSKSLGNSFFLKDALDIYDGEVLRFYLTSVHYRNDFNFNEEDLLTSKKRLDKIYRLKKRIVPTTPSTPNKEFEAKLLSAMSDDLNISVALSAIDEMIATANEELDSQNSPKNLKKETLANIELIDKLLGFGAKEPYSYFQIGVDSEQKEHIDSLIQKRAIAKSDKDFQTADSIRDELTSLGIAIMDTSDGTVWEKLEQGL